jgi:uncharacterized membrane protein YkvA (DUF1232 family)
MSIFGWILLAAGSALAVYAALVGVLLALGRRTDARALAGFVPDAAALFRALLKDPRVPRSRKLLLGATVGYLAVPVDLIPDFIPVVGQLDDAILVALALRSVVRAAGPELVWEHWRGPPSSRELVLRLAGGQGRSPDRASASR